MKIVKALILSSLVLMGASLVAQSKPGSVEANKKVVYDFYRVVWEPKNLEALPQFMSENYIEHNPQFNGGRDDLVGVLKSGRFGDWSKTSKPVTALKDPP